jgi:hypothetical protein
MFKTTFLVIIVAAFALWFFRDSETVHAVTNTVEPAVSPKLLEAVTADFKAVAANAAGESESAPPKIEGMKKCQTPKGTLYTDRPCPKNGQERSIAKGSVTVVAKQHVEAAHDSKLPNARDLLVDKNQTSIRDQQMEQAIDK